MMRRLAATMLSWIPFDPSSRRAIDETLLDWAHERAAAATPGARIAVNLRSTLALLRALVFASAAETWRVPTVWFVSRLLILLILPASLLTWPAFARLATSLKFPSLPAVDAFAMLVLNTATAIAPLAFFYFPGWLPRRRPVPLLGLALAAACLTLLATGWIVPATNQRFREVVYTTLGGRHWPYRAGGLTEMTLPALASSDVNAVGHLISRLGSVAAAGAFVYAGAVLMRGSRRRRLAAWVVPIACFYALLGLTDLLLASGVRPTVASALSIWTLTAAAMVTAVLLRPASLPDSRVALPTG